jgi:hypothetical protein
VSAAVDLVRLRAGCEQVLRASWHEGVRPLDAVPFAYTAPSVDHYPWQWYWDSCFTAISWRHFDPERSRRELQSLLTAQRADGFIGHTIFWDRPLSGARRLTYNVLSPGAPTTSTMQPPALAWAWSLAVGDPREEAPLALHHRWLEDHRTLDRDGLLWIVQPDESGLDASPQFDPIWGRQAHGLPGFVLLVRRNRRLGYDLREILRAGGPACCEVLTNVLYSLSRRALGLESLTTAMIERLYDAERGLFLPLARRGQGRTMVQERSPVATIAALTPLALPDLPEEIGHRLVAHLLDDGAFRTAVAPPSVSLAERSFTRRDRTLAGRAPARYWRGPTWVNTAWLCWLGLTRLGYAAEARAMADGLARAILREGLREYYDPFTGAGMGARDFGWSSLILEMVDGDSALE